MAACGTLLCNRAEPLDVSYQNCLERPGVPSRRGFGSVLAERNRTAEQWRPCHHASSDRQGDPTSNSCFWTRFFVNFNGAEAATRKEYKDLGPNGSETLMHSTIVHHSLQAFGVMVQETKRHQVKSITFHPPVKRIFPSGGPLPVHTCLAWPCFASADGFRVGPDRLEPVPEPVP